MISYRKYNLTTEEAEEQLASSMYFNVFTLALEFFTSSTDTSPSCIPR